MLGGLAVASGTLAWGSAAQASHPSPASPLAAPAAVPRDGTPVALRLEGTPLRTALEMLFTGSGQQLAVEPAVPDYPITLNIHGVPFDTALRTLLRLAPGATYRKEGEIYIVGMRQPAPEPAGNGSEPEPPVETEPAVGGEQVVRIPINYIHPAILAYVLNGRLVPTEDQFQPGIGGGGGNLGGYGGGLNGPGGAGAYGGLNGSGLGPAGYGTPETGSLNGFAPGYGINGNFGGSGQGLGPNVLVNPTGNSVVVAPQPRRF
jgi:hypothetical protein